MSTSDSGEPKSLISPAQIQLRTNNDAVEIRVLDASFNTVALGSGSLQKSLAAGIYQVRYQAGPLVQQKLVRLRPGETFEDHVELSVPSPTPLVGTETDLADARDAVSRLSSMPSVTSVGSAEFMLFLRRLGKRAAAVERSTLASFALHDEEGSLVYDFDTGVEQDTQEKNWVAASMRLNPGGHVLRYSAPPQQDGVEPQPIDQSIWITDGWRTTIFVPYRSRGSEPGLASIHMGRAWEPAPQSDPAGSRIALALETVLASLRRGQRAFYREHLDLLLSEKYKNPMLGIVGAHAILLSVEPDWELFDAVVQNLQDVVPGHPDVVALRLMGIQRRWLESDQRRRVDSDGKALTDATPPPPPELTITPSPAVAWPPMMATAYRCVLQCDAMWPELELIKAGSVCERAAPRTLFLGTWTTWLPLDGSIAKFGYRKTAVPPSNFVAQQAQRLVGWTLDRLGKGVARRDWQRFAKATFDDSAVDPAASRVQHYLGELVETTEANNAREFVEKLDVGQVSRAIGLPVRTVKSVREQLSASLDRFEKS